MENQKAKTFEERFEMLMASFEKSQENLEKSNEAHNETHKKFDIAHEKAMQEIQEIRDIQVENAKAIKEMSANIDKLSVSSDKTDIKLQKLSEKVDATTKNVNGIAKSNGMVAEETIFNSLDKDKIFGGIKFDEIERNVKLKSKMLNLQGEYDILLINGDTIAIIEAKWRVRPEDITKLTTKQVTNFRNIFPMFADYKIVLGIGGMAFEDNSENIAKASGVGVIKVLTDSVEFYTEGMRVY